MAGCKSSEWNNPYPVSQQGENILYSSFSSRPKHLDPVRSYSSNEYAFLGQIYEPPLQYHYLKRPYTLVPLTALAVPEPEALDSNGRVLPKGASQGEIAFTRYQIRIRPGIRYQPHPAFARDAQGGYLYRGLSSGELGRITTLADFRATGSRELVAADYVYQIKRLAHPRLHSPIFGLMSEYIVGLGEYSKTLKQVVEEQPQAKPVYINLDDIR